MKNSQEKVYIDAKVRHSATKGHKTGIYKIQCELHKVRKYGVEMIRGKRKEQVQIKGAKIQYK